MSMHDFIALCDTGVVVKEGVPPTFSCVWNPVSLGTEKKRGWDKT